MNPSFLPRAGETGADSLQLTKLPSVDALLNHPDLQTAVATHGRGLTKRAIQQTLARVRKSLSAAEGASIAREQLMRLIAQQIDAETLPGLRRVFNLTGTVIHTNLGRSPLPEAAIDALVHAARYPVTIEYELASGERGQHAVQPA